MQNLEGDCSERLMGMRVAWQTVGIHRENQKPAGTETRRIRSRFHELPPPTTIERFVDRLRTALSPKR